MNYSLDRASNLLQNRKFRKALRIFEELIEQSPGNGVFYEGAARCFLGLKSYAHALKYAKKAVEFNPKYTMAHVTLSYAYLNNNNLDSSYEAAVLAYQLEPESSYSLECLGTILVYKKKFNEAFDFLNKAVQINPKSAVGHYNLAYIYEELGKPDEAFAQRRLLFTTRPSIPYGYLILLSYIRRHPYITAWTIWIITGIAYLAELRFLLIIPVSFVAMLFWWLLSMLAKRNWLGVGLVVLLVVMFGTPVVYIFFLAR